MDKTNGCDWLFGDRGRNGWSKRNSVVVGARFGSGLFPLVLWLSCCVIKFVVPAGGVRLERACLFWVVEVTSIVQFAAAR